MTDTPGEDRWRVLSKMVEVRSPWLSLFGERLEDQAGNQFEYWRVERTDSLLVITVHDGRLVLPTRSYRPGVGRATLDFAGGRLQSVDMIPATAEEVVRREFNLDRGDLFASLEELNPIGWDVDSSSSNQRVFGVVGELRKQVSVAEHSIGASYPATGPGARELLGDLVCVQCRALLQDWLAKSGM